MGNKKTEPELNAKFVRSAIKSTVAKMGPEFTKEQRKEHAKILVKIFEKGLTPQEAMNVSDTEIAEMYNFARNLFDSGKYVEARELFKMLCTLSPYEAGFAIALGACHHKLNDYKNALTAYMLGAGLEKDNPVPLFYCYDCFLKSNDQVSAGIMLCNVIARSGDQPQYAEIKERASLLLEPLEKEIAEKNKKK